MMDSKPHHNASNASQRAAAPKNNPVLVNAGADEEVPF